MKGNNKIVEWCEKHDLALKALKNAFSIPFEAKKPILNVPFNLCINIDDDAGKVHGTFTQINPSDRVEIVNLLISKNFNAIQNRYTIHEKWLLGLYMCLDKIKTLMYGRIIKIGE